MSDLAGAVTKQKRTKSGCLACRAKRKKCDEARPKCQKCVRGNEACEYGPAVTFRPVSLDGARPSSSARGGTSRAGKGSPQGSSLGSNIALQLGHGAANQDAALPTPDDEVAGNDTTAGPDEAEDSPPNNTEANGSLDINSNPSTDNNLVSSSSLLPPDAGNGNGASRLQTFFVEQPLSTVASGATAIGNDVYGMSTFGASPEDGIFEPGSAYQSLYRTLRRKVFHAAARAEETPQPLQAQSGHHRPVSHPSSGSPDLTRRLERQDASESDADSELDAQQEYELWKVWTEEVASWLDKVDRFQHFRYALPILAKEKPHLKFSMLSLSARYLETIGKEVPTGLSLALYQHAIQLLVPQLYVPDTAVVASCVVLCVVEMYSCAPQAWKRHLDGCASLIQAMNITGDSGGLEEALFWCFARMDLCGGLISFERTLIPITKWSSGVRHHADFSTYLSSAYFEDYAKLAFTLAAAAIDIFTTYQASEGAFGSSAATSTDNQTAYATEWQNLFTALETWFALRPPAMQPLLSIPNTTTTTSATTTSATTTTTPPPSPFPTVLYSSAAAFSGNQFAHTAAILLLQRKPRHPLPNPSPSPSPKPKSILYHARQICGIALSNDHHGGWMNSIQPIWIAGKCMSHRSEHLALLAWLGRVEAETGWATLWRRRDLEGYWGWGDED